MIATGIQAVECIPGEDVEVKAKNGIVQAKAKGIMYKFPVPKQISQLNCAILGIGPMFSTQIKLNDGGKEAIEAIKKFYPGKIIHGLKVAKFKRTEVVPGIFAQQSKSCKGKKGIVLELDESSSCENATDENEKSLTFKIFPQCI